MASPSADDYIPGHGDPRFGVANYDLELVYKPDGNHLRGHAVLDVDPVSDLDEIVLDLRHLNVSRVTLDGRPVRYQTKGERLAVKPPSRLAAGTRVKLAIFYAGRPRPIRSRHLGAAGWEELNDGVLAASQPHGAPSWFPCNDRADDKASYTFTLTVPQAYTALANGVLVDRSHSSSTTTTRYRQEQPISPYLAAVHVGRYERFELDGPVPTHAYAASGAKDKLKVAFGKQGEMLRVFTELFGPYPYADYGVVVTPDDLEIPLESVGFSTFGSNHLTAGWEVERLVAHELSHQWFGNSVTASRWSDIWLHEGFACYAEWLWAEASGYATTEELARRHFDGLARKPQDLLLSDPGPELMFDDRVYKRGALTVHALRRHIGERAFHALLRDWTGRHAHSIVSTSDFIGLAGSHTLKDVDGIFDSWLFSKSLPARP